ncbi:oligosaccharide flippase family protein [Nostoc sp. 106C]|uniref:oligosaccharide flippase family protein n=1 Tax=Nostoc sp. 106C TaxID=1932667 RepID=UPI000A3BE900|nr:oligosaccharide flippase family protein [Nostoc sp. 106C]OUL27223.1 polysaccharide biosynthesis protein [Nostoc sp. RF31YmG]OUL33264.1 polysaccharide biosynthesis protein [Nostoc sp. 106C]
MQVNKPLTLRRNFSWTFIGNAVYAACQWGMLVLLAKLGSPEMVGQFTLGLAVTAPVIMFTNLQLRVVQATDAKKQYIFSDYLGLRLIGSGLALVIIATITLLAGYQWETSVVILLVGLAKAFEAISDVFYGLLQQHERMDRIALSLMIKGPLSLLLLGIGVYISGNIVWGVVGLVCAWAIVLLTYDIRNGALILNQVSQVQPRWHLATLAKLVPLALPLGLVMMLISLNTNIPRYFIEHYLGENRLGIFAAISYLMVAEQMIVSALADSAVPRLAKYYANQNSAAFRMLLFKLGAVNALIGGAGVVVALVAGKEVLTLLYRPEYAQYTEVFTLLMIGAAINYTFACLGYGRTAARYFLIQVPLSFLVTSSSTLACFWLIPNQGLRGAAIALIIAAIVEAGSNLCVLLHAFKRISPPFNKKDKNYEGK